MVRSFKIAKHPATKMNHEDYWLHIPIEVKHREFHSRLLLAALAANDGFKVLLAQDRMFRRLAPILPKGVLLDKGLGLARHGKTKRNHSLGYKVVIHDEEATGYFGSPEHTIMTRMEDETLAFCESWYCLSASIKEHSTRVFPQHSDKFKLTGLLRTDIWNKRFIGFFKEKSNEIKAELGPYILFNSNFGINIHARGDKFVVKQQRAMNTAYADALEEKIRVKCEGKPNLDAFVEIIPKITRWYPNHKLVIRPHPSEDVAFWKDTFSDHQNVVVRSDGVAAPWIISSDIMIHHGCTTSIEAELFEKKHVMYAPYPDRHHDTDFNAAFSPRVHNEEDLKAFFKANIGKTGSWGDITEKSKYFHNLDDRLVSEAIYEDIKSLKFVSNEKVTSWIPLHIRLRNLMAKFKLRSRQDTAYSNQKWPGCSVEEIADGLRVAKEGLGLPSDFDVEEVYDDVWVISKASNQTTA